MLTLGRRPVTIGALALAALVTASAPAFAYPSTQYVASYSSTSHNVACTGAPKGFTRPAGGAAWGSVTWYNESVGIQGAVENNCSLAGYPTADSVSVGFEFDLSDGSYWAETTRTTESGELSYHFTQDGPPGGIGFVDVWVCDNTEHNCGDVVRVPRPSADGANTTVQLGLPTG